MDLKNKVIWITGASSGIGEATTIELSKMDCKLIISSRNERQLESVKKAAMHPKNIKILTLDLEQYETLEVITHKAIELFGHIDILINNGGISQRALAKDTLLKVDKKMMDVNYFGTVALSKALLPHFTDRKSGQFVVVTSVVGKVATPVRSSYSASKHALHGFFDSLRAEVHKHNIVVTLIMPGYVRTRLSFNALVGNGELQNKMDVATDNGILPEVFAKKMIRAMSRKKREVVIGGLKETASIYLKRISPALLAKVVRKVNVT
ncbi:MAG: short-chain dehydrogenase [Bacteroidetes bacterium MedPE-SWsnd-G1]|nr:MAG: short-chain dehydrogenase [Bacteroidetes bacterium MedPE-SWsnd-G1]